MMTLSDFFKPIEIERMSPSNGYPVSSIGAIINPYVNEFPSLEGVQLAIVGVEDDRQSIENNGCALAPDYIREQLYPLYEGNFKLKMVDLGNIKPGAEVSDTYAALKIVVNELIKSKIIPIIIGGGQDLTYAQYLGYEKLEKKVDVLIVDRLFDLDNSDEEGAVNSANYLNKIILHQPNFLFNLCNLAYQTYLIVPEYIRLMEKLYFDTYRLGEVSNKIADMEPAIRNADMLSFDINAVRMSDAPAHANAGPNGLYGEEACQLCRYAGMSDKLSSIGFYEMNPAFDQQQQTSQLVAQMIWCFIEGYYLRKNELPTMHKSHFIKYRANLKETDHEVVFYKSKKSDRWWMQVPYPDSGSKNERFHLVPCAYADYQTACDGEMPDRWWKTFQKLV